MSAVEPEGEIIEFRPLPRPDLEAATEQLQRVARRAQSRTRRAEQHERRAEAGIGRYAPSWEGKGNARKLRLAPLPEAGDHTGLCAWLTATFNLDPEHPITGGLRTGARSEDGIVALDRRDAPRLYFNPVAKLATAAKLLGALSLDSPRRRIGSSGSQHRMTS